MSPCESALAEIRSTACNKVEKRLWLEAKGEVRRLGEIPQREIFLSCKCVIKVPDSEVKDVFGQFTLGRRPERIIMMMIMTMMITVITVITRSMNDKLFSGKVTATMNDPVRIKVCKVKQ